jgi:cell wall assembly regulator SMI1
MSGIVEHAKQVLQWLSAHQRAAARLLRPGLSPQELDRLQAELGWRLPTEAIELFRWQNGVADDSGVTLDDIHFFPGFHLLSFDEALQQMKVHIAAGAWKSRWFPVFGNGGGDFKVLDCARMKGCDSAPVLGFWRGDPDPSEEYCSLSAMMQTIAECFATGAFFLKDGYLEIDDAKHTQIAREFNPHVEMWWR